MAMTPAAMESAVMSAIAQAFGDPAGPMQQARQEIQTLRGTVEQLQGERQVLTKTVENAEERVVTIESVLTQQLSDLKKLHSDLNT